MGDNELSTRPAEAPGKLLTILLSSLVLAMMLLAGSWWWRSHEDGSVLSAAMQLPAGELFEHVQLRDVTISRALLDRTEFWLVSALPAALGVDLDRLVSVSRATYGEEGDIVVLRGELDTTDLRSRLSDEGYAEVEVIPGWRVWQQADGSEAVLILEGGEVMRVRGQLDVLVKRLEGLPDTVTPISDDLGTSRLPLDWPLIRTERNENGITRIAARPIDATSVEVILEAPAPVEAGALTAKGYDAVSVEAGPPARASWQMPIEEFLR